MVNTDLNSIYGDSRNTPGAERNRDTQLGTGDTSNTLEKFQIPTIGLILSDTSYGSNLGDAVDNSAGRNNIKDLLPRMPQLVETVTTFSYKVS